MRPRNILTETNDMRRLMGLPLINEDGGQTIDDVKKKVLNENLPAGFSLGFANAGGLTIAEEDLEPMEDNVMQEDIDEADEAEEFNDEGDDDLDVVEEDKMGYSEIEKAQKMAEERELKSKELNIKSNKDPMEDNLTEDTGFAKYNITLEDGDIKKRLDEGWYDRKDWDKQVTRDVGDKEPNDDIKKDVKRIISFLTPGEGDEIEGKYMDKIYPAMALQTAQILYDKL